MVVYLATPAGGSYLRNDLTAGLQPVPNLMWLRSALREVRRIERLNGHPLTRASVEYAYRLSISQLTDE